VPFDALRQNILSNADNLITILDRMTSHEPTRSSASDGAARS
jgi:hypothetical protein